MVKNDTKAPAFYAAVATIPLLALWVAVGARLAAAAAPASAETPGRVVAPFETAEAGPPATTIDKLVVAGLDRKGLQPARICSDEVFIRRVYLDVIGTPPGPQEVNKFLQDRTPGKRAVLIDTLLGRGEFADYWAMKWCDILRVKAEFPINLWPNAVQAYHHWIREAIARNMPYDQFARELLTSSGSNFRVPPVNFYRAIQGRKPAAIAAAVALAFMGTRLDGWPEDRRAQMEAFFSRLAYKYTSEWKEEIVCLDPATTQTLQATLPDGAKLTFPPGSDPRLAFADWLVRKDNPWFARCAVNRIWTWLFGRGIINEPDDIRPDNPPSNPELLAYLEKELVESHYDLLHIYRLILNSRTYQQSSIPQSKGPGAEALFAVYPVRRLDAEVLIDALCEIFGSDEEYESPIPEPFTYLPAGQRAVDVADGSITSSFLEMFGRPPRDTGLMSERNNQPSDEQRLHMLNSSHIQRKIQNGWRMKFLTRIAGGNRYTLIRWIYLTILSRYPTSEEMVAAGKYFQTPRVDSTQAANDLAWALVNTKEFLYRH
ncbi:MAG: DUF1549 and DUF1553 domain-containing protein [bacterium]|nr:DUF1549 and DUF1553 domain-containing protein [bacterium]